MREILLIQPLANLFNSVGSRREKSDIQYRSKGPFGIRLENATVRNDGAEGILGVDGERGGISGVVCRNCDGRI